MPIGSVLKSLTYGTRAAPIVSVDGNGSSIPIIGDGSKTVPPAADRIAQKSR
jgi:hypothetical protein